MATRGKDLTTRETLLVIALTLTNLASTGLWTYLASIAWDRQHSVEILETAKVFDQWDGFGLPQPQVIGLAEKGNRLRVLARFHSIEGGGTRVRLSDGRYAHLIPFFSDGDYQMTIRLEPISLLFVAALGAALGWAWSFLSGKRRFSTMLRFAVVLLVMSYEANVILTHGVV